MFLQRLRTGARLTQEQLAERAAVSVRTIRNLESGRIRSPRPDSLRQLAEGLGITGAELADFEAIGRHGYWSDRNSTTHPEPVARGRPVPAQLPADVIDFTGREPHISALDALLERALDLSGAAPRTAVLVGAPGVGKTALALHWSHRSRRHFPDGQLYVNLASYSTSAPVSTTDALAYLLRALGVAPDRVPSDPAEAAALLRSVLADTRTLIVLDDVRHAGQVLSLMPGAPGCFVLVTSRTSQRALVARTGAHQRRLLPLAPDESHELLSRVLGSAMTRAEQSAAVELAELCGHLPLALRIAAANLADRPGGCPLGTYVQLLRRTDRLAALSASPDPDMAVRTAFDLSYRALPAPAQRLFRLVALAPAREVTTAAADALLGAGDETEELLEVLTAAHLMEQTGADRFVQPDLLRLYAVERSIREDTDAERATAWERLLAGYLDVLDDAAALLYPGALRLAPRDKTERDGTERNRFADHRDALEWVDTELPALQAAVLVAADTGPRSAAWLLADALRGYFQLRGTTGPWHVIAGAALSAAEAGSDSAAQAGSHLGLAGAFAAQHRYDQATHHGERALELARSARWTAGEASAHRAIGNLRRLSGRPTEAVAQFQMALALAPPGHEAGRAALIELIATTHHELGRLAEAAAHYEKALAVHRALGSSTPAAQVMTGLGDVLNELGRPDEALHYLNEARTVHNELADRGREAYNLRCQAEVHRDTGRLDEALRLAHQALELACRNDLPRVQAQATETIGSIHLKSGRYPAALAQLDAALGMAVSTNNPYAQAQTMIGLSTVHRHTGNGTSAVEYAFEAVELARRGSYTLLIGQAMTALARAELATGLIDAAAEHSRAAIAAHDVTGCAAGRADAEQALLEALARLPDGSN
ncbi:ATP-binding protein [Pseudonocardia sp. TRM90224]|uniref:ATP-binding protein n=1 Tax=Pseudonocardia sp. TRM90224 TaxID=2812678 RepID=UPI001E384376|nr:helix-turn-helix domain-containing protein [Pseudonocardia sp. TRM90224]